MKFKPAASYVNKLGVLSIGIAIALLMPATTFAATSGFAASDVLGQLTNGAPDFTTSGSGVGADHLHYPAGIVIDSVHHRLFVADNTNNRVLVYNLNSSNNLIDHTADYVLGQPNFSTQQNTTSQTGLNSPYAGLAYDGINDRLFVADSNSNRVLIYNLSTGITNGMNASHILGQPNFTSNATNLSQAGLYSPDGLAYDPVHQALYVADGNNSRVVVYNVAPGSTVDGMNATHVIGQANFTSNSTVTTQAGMQHPIAIAFNGVTQTLFVGDNNSNRILIYNLANGTSDGMSASHVLGQPDFISGSGPSGAPSASTTQAPEALAVDTQRNVLYVQDDSNNRVVAFDLSGGITNNMNARLVIGQVDFAGSDFSCSPISATTLCDSEGGLAVDPVNDRLYITDASFNRVLIYNFAHFTTPAGSLTTATNGQPYSFTVATAGQQGTGLFSKVSGNLPPGLTLNTSTGVISGTPTQAGNYSFELGFEDTLGVVGSTYDDPSYTITVVATTATSSLAPGAPNTGLHPGNNRGSLLALTGGLILSAVNATWAYRRASQQKITF